jgi:hypothetical protein
MAKGDLCPVRDKIDDRDFGVAAQIAAITPEYLASVALGALRASNEARRCRDHF